MLRRQFVRFAVVVLLGSAVWWSQLDADEPTSTSTTPIAPAAGTTATSTPAESSTATAESPTAAADAELKREIDAIVDADEFKHSHWGVLAVDLSSGRTLYERNADKLFAPASVTKLFSVAAALDELGADYVFSTPVYARGEIDESGVLDGDLILVASGDPTLGGRDDGAGGLAFKDTDHTYAGFSTNAELTSADPLAGLDKLARQAAAAGITQVLGDIVIDDRLFGPAGGSGSGPQRLTPIVVNDNVLDFTITPGAEPGDEAMVRCRPATSAFTIDAIVETGSKESAPRILIDEPLVGTITVRGSIPVGHRPLVLIHAVDRPASFARSLFIEALRRAEVRVAASPLVDNAPEKLPPRGDYDKLRRVAELKSPRFAEEARLILKVSHNLHAGMMPLLLGSRHDKRTMPEGLKYERDALARLGVSVDSISFAGGAGGDRADYVTPRATIELLTAMSRHKSFDDYRAALPVLGVDGTLASAVSKESPAAGKVRAKTGTLLWTNHLDGRPLLQSKALAGYAETKGGKTVAFAMFVNLVRLEEPGDRERIGRVLGSICEKLFDYSAGG
jgi:D-alanyl-D-alanine carboxypeptidase/D-alanyl-D-alanine-endopeptidase (penicillin-binding protein 4)